MTYHPVDIRCLLRVSCLETLIEIGCILKTTSDIRLASQTADSLKIFKTLMLPQLSPSKKCEYCIINQLLGLESLPFLSLRGIPTSIHTSCEGLPWQGQETQRQEQTGKTHFEFFIRPETRFDQNQMEKGKGFPFMRILPGLKACCATTCSVAFTGALSSAVQSKC